MGTTFHVWRVICGLPFTGERCEWWEDMGNENITRDKNNGMHYVYKYNAYVVIVRRKHFARKNTTIIIS
jgi:hypothetical protein